eukprot:TRINITY_DN12549_c0_g2_i1.p1 TRINITY_DN12549_c0_g2~~TRINITY_DN12549_c0_g2_i1.p1  ORF type:complete len:830 (+),score=78.13 TRINITY_DN12549_c0_g2_i1:97-2586(+)
MPEHREEDMNTLDCWTGSHTPKLCCDVRLSPVGRAECWDGYYTFAKCCIGLGLASGAVTTQMVPSLLPPPPQNITPSKATFTKPLVTTASAQPVTVQAANAQAGAWCWSEGYTAEWCCDVSISPSGRRECWAGSFTFAACCGGEAPAVQAKKVLPDCKASSWPRTLCCDRKVKLPLEGKSRCWGFGIDRPQKGSPRENECCSCEAMFFACEECVEMAQREMLDLGDLHACAAAGRVGFVELRWDDMKPYAACVPNYRWCPTERLPRLIDRVEHLLDRVPRFDVQKACGKRWWLTVDSFVSVFIVFAALFAKAVFRRPLPTGGHVCSFDGKSASVDVIGPGSGPRLSVQGTHIEPTTGSRSTFGRAAALIPSGGAGGSTHDDEGSSSDANSTRVSRGTDSGSGTAHMNVAFPSDGNRMFQRPRNPQADLLRVISTICVMALHLNIAIPNVTPAGTSYFQGLNRVSRFVDGYTVLSVVLIADAGNLDILAASDRIWRKMVRQWPIFLFPFHLITDGWCTRITTCFPSDAAVNSELPLWKRAVLRLAWRSEEADSWPYTLELWIYLALVSLSVCQHYFGLHFYRAVFVAIIAYNWNTCVIDNADYFGFTTYRLPMALLMFWLARCPRLFHLASVRPRFSRALVFGLICGGLAPPVSDLSLYTSWTLPRHFREGRYFVLYGLSFHLGLLWLLKCPELLPLPQHGLFNNCLRSMADLCFPVSLCHRFILESWRRCQQTTRASWIFVYYEGQHSFRSSTCHHERPLSTRMLGGFVVVSSSLALSWALVKFVQRPWLILASNVWPRLRHFLTAAFILLVLFDGFVLDIILARSVER